MGQTRTLKVGSWQLAVGSACCLLLVSCRKELDTPPEQTLPTGSVITMSQLRAMYAGAPVHFPDPMSVYAVVTADETNGNLYKEVYVQDDSAAINVRLQYSGGLYQGDRIRIYLPGCVLSSYNGMLQLDSVDVDNNVVKQETDVYVAPRQVTVAEITPDLQGFLVRLDSVEFILDELGLTYADAVNQLDENRTLEECNGDQILVRSSGYANFAANTLPVGRGPFTGVVGQFGSTMQLYIRDLAEVQLNGDRCAGQGIPILIKNFEDLSLTSGGWTQQGVSGAIPWSASSFSGDNFAKINNFVGGSNNACETWYFSPAVDLTVSPTPVLTFRTAANFDGPDLEVLVSTDWDGTSAPSTATWTPLAPALSPGSYTWTDSGPLSLSAFLSANFHVAFRYTGSDSDGKVYEVDDITITEN